MVAAGWTPTVATYLGRVTKARILLAVEEGRGKPAAARIDHLRKGEMAEAAEKLLAGSGWLPEPLRTPGRVFATAVDTVEAEPVTAAEPAVEETAANDGEPAVAGDDAVSEDEDVTKPVEEQEAAVAGESSLADDDSDDQDAAFEPHAIAAE